MFASENLMVLVKNLPYAPSPNDVLYLYDFCRDDPLKSCTLKRSIYDQDDAYE